MKNLLLYSTAPYNPEATTLKAHLAGPTSSRHESPVRSAYSGTHSRNTLSQRSQQPSRSRSNYSRQSDLYLKDFKDRSWQHTYQTPHSSNQRAANGNPNYLQYYKEKKLVAPKVTE